MSLPSLRRRGPALPVFGALAAMLGAPTALGQTPQWIWHPGPPAAAAETVYFRKPFRTPPYTWNARLTVVADDEAEVLLNGKRVAVCRHWDQPVRAEVSVNLIQGDNLLAVRARHRGGPAGLLLHLNLGGTETRQVISDDTWRVSTAEAPSWAEASFDDSDWAFAESRGPHGIAPWGDVLARASATAAESLRLLPGFQAELLRSAAPDEGSWVCMTFDDRGRLYLSPEGDGKPLLRCAFDDQGAVATIEPVPAPIRFAMGLLHAHGSLYANAKGPEGNGLYRLTDADGNDRFDRDEWRLLKKFKGGGEHGYHALALGPDQHIYVLNGNVTGLPEGIADASPYRHYGEDVLSLNPDETTRAGGALAPGSYILRTDPEGRHWELLAGGMRNAYGFDFGPDGELFAFDSDNEWDWGMPWYRPTRLYHVVSGAEMGWRDGTRAWPDTYPDQVQGVVDIGIGSPCGVKFGARARFPEKYRRALYLQDWSYGRILAVHLEPRGATYRGTFEEFVRGQPLNLTSLDFGPDGALYFVTGGRGTQSGLYRVRHTDAAEGASAPTSVPARNAPPDASARARALRREIERFHTRADAAAVAAVWPHLGSPDPSLRFAARVALEAQPLETWIPRATTETHATPALHALLAMARVGPASRQADLLEALDRFPFAALDEEHRLLKLRILQLSLLRQGLPEGEPLRRIREEYSARFPSATWAENRELVRILTRLEAGVVSRTLKLLQDAPTQQQQVHYIAQLRNLRTGWTAGERDQYFQWWIQPRDHLQQPGSLLHWFHDVDRAYVDGANVNRHLEGFRRDAIAALPDDERARLEPLLDRPVAGAQLVPAQPRSFVRAWTLDELLPALDEASGPRQFERGRRAFIDTQCYACHRLGNTGGAVGPELTAVSSKYGRRELLEALVDPSKVISEQYQNLRVFLKDGEEVTGRLVRESADEVVLETDPLARTEQTVPRSAIEAMRPSAVSAMPEGLLNSLTRDEILDLLAFMESGGNPDAPAFAAPRPTAPR